MPQKDTVYHESAIQYNDEIAEFTDELAERIDHPEVARWSRAVAKQHRFHSGRHKKALSKLNTSDDSTADTEDGGEDQALDAPPSSVAEQQEEYASRQTDARPLQVVPDPTQAANPVHNQGEGV